MCKYCISRVHVGVDAKQALNTSFCTNRTAVSYAATYTPVSPLSSELQQRALRVPAQDHGAAFLTAWMDEYRVTVSITEASTEYSITASGTEVLPSAWAAAYTT